MNRYALLTAAAALILALASSGLAAIMWSSSDIQPNISLTYQDPVTLSTMTRNCTSSNLYDILEFHRDSDGNLYMYLHVENDEGLDITLDAVGAGVPKEKGGSEYVVCWNSDLPDASLIFDDNIEIVQPESIYAVGKYSYDSYNVGYCELWVYAAGSMELYGMTTPARMVLKATVRNMPPALSNFSISGV